MALGESNGARARAVSAVSVVFTQKRTTSAPRTAPSSVRRFDAHTLFEVQRVEQEAILVHRFNERRAADHDDRGSSASQHAAEITADGSGADHGDFGPGDGLGHVVITEIRRSMSRSVLNK